MSSKSCGDKTVRFSHNRSPALFLEDKPQDSSLWAVAGEVNEAGFSTKKDLVILTFLTWFVMSPSAA